MMPLPSFMMTILMTLITKLTIMMKMTILVKLVSFLTIEVDILFISVTILMINLTILVPILTNLVNILTITVVNILHKWVKLFPDGHFQAHKLFPEIKRKSRLFTGYFTFILRKF